MSIEFQFYTMKKVTELDGGGFTTMLMYLMPLNCILKKGYDGKFHVVYILPQF